MNLYLVLGLIVLAVIALRLLPRGKRSQTLYTAAGPLCTPAELAFLRVLEQVVTSDQHIFAKVRLIDVVAPAARDQHAARNRIIQKHLDFVICDRATTRPLYAIELNDRSHESAARRERDDFVQDVMGAAGIPLIFHRCAKSYRLEDLRAVIEAKAIGPARLQQAAGPIRATR